MSLPLNNPKHEVGSASSSWMTKIPELGPSGGDEESASGDFLYNERGLVTYMLFNLIFFTVLFRQRPEIELEHQLLKEHKAMV